MVHYFRTPFGVSGDRAAIPNDTEDHVNYTDGWGPDYSLDLQSDPSALAIERTKTNQLMYDITTVLQQYQQFGVPDWIAAADNGGVDLEYAVGARVRYDDTVNIYVYESLTPANTALPTDTANWRLITIPGIGPGATGTGNIVLAIGAVAAFGYGTSMQFTGPPGQFNSGLCTQNYTDLTFNDQLFPVYIPFTTRVSSYPDNLIATYDNGAAGVGATLTNDDTLAGLIMQGVVLDNGDEVIIPSQDDLTENGKYVVTDKGSGATPWILTRSTDYDTPAKIMGDPDGNFYNQYIEQTQGNYTQWIWWNHNIITEIGVDEIDYYTSSNKNGFVPRDPYSGPYHTPGQTYIADPNGILQPMTLFGAITINSAGGTTFLRSPNYQGGDWTLALTDADSAPIMMTSGSANILTVPLHATVAFPLGATIRCIQSGAGQTTITAAGGVTIHTALPGLKSRAQYSEFFLTYYGSDIWISSGDLAA